MYGLAIVVFAIRRENSDRQAAETVLPLKRVMNV